MKKYLLIFISVFTLTFTAKAQDGFEKLLLANPADANKLMQGYFNPAMKGFIYGMNNGWYHTAKVHKTLGFDLTIGLSGSFVPTKDEVFDISGLSSISSSSPTAATFAGSKTPTLVTVNRTVDGQPVSTSFEIPGGIKDDLPLNAIPAPVAQLNVGLPFDMEAMVRFFPKTDLGDDGGTASMLGLGLKKEITSWFGPLDKLPLHISVLAAYTSMDVNYGINSNTASLQANGEASFELKAYTVQAIASLNFPFINVYGGIGYSSGSSNLKTTGTYTAVYNTGLPSPNDKKTHTIPTADLPNLEFDASGVKTTLGARLSLGFFKVFADYTLQEYNTVSFGISLGLR